MPNKKVEVKEVKVSKPAAKVAPKTEKTTKESSMSISVYALDGSKKGTVSLPKEIFGAKVNTDLMTQAVRVYLVNQRQGTAEAKTRGEVSLTTAKWYRQKGTGRARHGAQSAPIFVGGGVAHGPRNRKFELKLSKQMRKKALFSALTSKLAENGIFVLDGATATGKTKEVANVLKKMNLESKVLFVAQGNVARAARNMSAVALIAPHAINTYEVLNSRAIVFDKGAIETLEKTFLAKEN